MSERITTGQTDILLAEDEDTLREDLEYFIVEWGYPLKGLKRGDDALDYFLQHSDVIRVAVLDHDLPGLAGASVARAIRELSDRVHIVCISSSAKEGHEAYEAFGRAESGTIFIPKSTTIKNDLKDCLKRLFEQ